MSTPLIPSWRREAPRSFGESRIKRVTLADTIPVNIRIDGLLAESVRPMHLASNDLVRFATANYQVSHRPATCCRHPADP